MPTATTPPGPSTTTSPPVNPHTSDPILQPFLGPTFDPTAYLNNALPSLAVPTTNQPIVSSKSLSVSDLSSRTQSHIAQLSAQTTRLSDILTELTDAILRSGPRLAYNVELLRGEANALADAMADTLQEEVKIFVPAGLDAAAKEEHNVDGETAENAKVVPKTEVENPKDLSRLRDLHLVRSRLQDVIKTFDSAMAWPIPPSSLSIAQSFVSVSGPDATDQVSLEERGQAAQKELRDSVTELLAPNGRSAGAEGVIKAEKRVNELRTLVEVWKGTAEEKARSKFVEGLEKMVADRRREEENKGSLKGKEEVEREEQQKAAETKSRGGLFGGLRRLRDEIYME